MKEFIGTCVENPFGTVSKLNAIIDKGCKVSRKRFFETCDLLDEEKNVMRQYPNDFRFYVSGKIWFYEWSCIEHFYQ